MGKRWAFVLLIAGVLGLWFGVPSNDWLIWPGATALATSLGLVTGWITFPRKSISAVTLGSDGYRLLPRHLVRERFWSITIPLGAATVTGIVLAIRAALRGRALSQGDQWLIALAGLLLVAQVVVLARYLAIGRYAIEPVLTLSTDQPRLDQTFQIRLDLKAIKPAHLAECRACLRCFEHVLLHYGRYTHIDVRAHGGQIHELGQEIDLQPGQSFSASSEVLLDSAKYVPTGKLGVTMYPYYHWEIQIELGGKPRPATIFPVTILAASK